MIRSRSRGWSVRPNAERISSPAAPIPDSAVVTVIPYFELDEQHRLDVAGVDAHGDVVVTLEAERVNHDIEYVRDNLLP